MSSGILDVIAQARNAMSAFEESLQIHNANSAHMATAGYKALRSSFKTVFNDVVSQGLERGDVSSNPVQYGSSVTMGNVSLDFSQGSLGEGSALDCAVSGRGLFIVSPDGGKTKYYTRSGEFHVDASGQYVVDSSGRMLLGTSPGGSATSLTPIKTNGYTDLGWAAGGVLIGNYTDFSENSASATQLYQVALADFPNIEGLVQYDGTTFKESVVSGSPNKYGLSGQDSFGTVEPQQLEKSNVFYIGETIDALEVQRAMSAALTAIKMANDQISQVVNKLFS
jgi:flagellar hook protein FlgE